MTSALIRLTAQELTRRMAFAEDEVDSIERCLAIARDEHQQQLIFDSSVVVVEGPPFDDDMPVECVVEDMALEVEANLKELRGRFDVELPWKSVPSSQSEPRPGV